MNNYYLYKIEDLNANVLFVGFTNNLKNSLNYPNLPAEIIDNFEEKHVEKNFRFYVHKCESKSDLKIKKLYLIVKYNPIYNNNRFLEGDIKFEIPILWKKYLFSNFQFKKANNKDIKVFILNLDKSSYLKLMNIYSEYNLHNNLLEFRLTEFIEIVILFYADYLKKQTFFSKITESFKELLLRPGRRPFRDSIGKYKISSCINFDVNIYNTFLDVTYSHVINYDKLNSNNYSLSFMTMKLIDFIESNKKSFMKYKINS